MSKTSQIFGIMANISVKLPPGSKKEAARHVEMNKEIEDAGLAFRTVRIATDWGYKTFDALKEAMGAPSEQPKRPQQDRLKSGMLVRIFKTVSDGDVLWEGDVNLEYDREVHKAATGYKQQALGGYWVHGLQEGMAPLNWGRMFFQNLPAKLERDGEVIYGALEPFAETGTEGVIWSLHEYGRAGYEGLHCLKNGDKLTVYSAVYDGDVDWEGELLFGGTIPTKLDWEEIMRFPLHMDERQWLQLSYQNRPIAIRPD